MYYYQDTFVLQDFRYSSLCVCYAICYVFLSFITCVTFLFYFVFFMLSHQSPCLFSFYISRLMWHWCILYSRNQFHFIFSLLHLSIRSSLIFPMTRQFQSRSRNLLLSLFNKRQHVTCMSVCVFWPASNIVVSFHATARGPPGQNSRASIAFPTLPFSTRKPAFQDDAIASEYNLNPISVKLSRFIPILQFRILFPSFLILYLIEYLYCLRLLQRKPKIYISHKLKIKQHCMG